MNKIKLSWTGGTFFEDDAVFAERGDALRVIMSMYKKSCVTANVRSQEYVETNDTEAMRKALWSIAQKKVIEKVLALFQIEDEGDGFEVDLEHKLPDYLLNHDLYGD